MKQEVHSLLSRLNLDAVRDAVRETPLHEWDYDGVFARVLTAADMWLLDDLKADTLLVEQEFDVVVKGVIDLILIKNGECGIVDWKTTGSVKRPNYIEETKSEFQTSFYLSYGGDWIEEKFGVRPKWIEYRALDEAGELRSFRVESTLRDRYDADEQIQGVRTLYNALDQGPWPRNRPRACFVGSKGGPTCPFYRDCVEMTMPLEHTAKFEDCVPRSKSSIKSFLHCPEKYRREKLVGIAPASNDAIDFGVAFHRGIEEVYSQAWELTHSA